MAFKRYWEMPLKKEKMKNDLQNEWKERLLKQGKRERRP